MYKNKFQDIFFFIVFFIFFYFTPYKINVDLSIFLTVSTFLFAIFSGFFISRQSTRAGNIRDAISKFDGEFSAIYRQLGHIDKQAQKEYVFIVEKYYNNIIKNKSWDYNFNHKTTAIIDTHALVERYAKDKKFASLKNLALERVLTSLKDIQSLRKKMISLYKERIPSEQWRLIYFLAIILLATIFSIVSYGSIVSSLLKVAFSSSVLMVLFLLKQLDRLRFFEGVIGENSAKDVLDIMHGKK